MVFFDRLSGRRQPSLGKERRHVPDRRYQKPIWIGEAVGSRVRYFLNGKELYYQAQRQNLQASTIKKLAKVEIIPPFSS